jgi:hypothetical protein
VVERLPPAADPGRGREGTEVGMSTQAGKLIDEEAVLDALNTIIDPCSVFLPEHRPDLPRWESCVTWRSAASPAPR